MKQRPGLMSLAAAILGVLGGAGASGLVASGAEAALRQPVMRRREEEDRPHELLLVAPRDDSRLLLAGHSSHRSHSSHASHSSHYSGRGSWSGGGSDVEVPAAAIPRAATSRVKPAFVSLVAFPGGRILVDGQARGKDATGRLKLTPGKHQVRIENQFLGNGDVEIEVSDGQTGEIKVDW